MEASALHAPVRTPRISLSASLLRLRSDEQLVALFRAGDEGAFAVIHDRYRARLIAYSRQMLRGSRPDAEDAVQDVFVRTHSALRANGRPISLRAWLYRVAHNRCIDQLRRPAETPTEELELATVAAGPEAEAERKEDLRRLLDDVRRLPDQQRSALLMRELEGLSYANLADALDVTVPAVKSLLVRARIGLVEAAEARETDCHEIRSDLALAHRRGVRSSGRARRHLRDCAGCRQFRSRMREVDRVLASVPFPSPGILAKLLGLGGAGGGAAAAGGATTGGGIAAGGSAAAGGMTALGLTTAKVVVVVATAALATGGAVVIHHRLDASHTAPAAATATATAPGVRAGLHSRAAHTRARHAPASLAAAARAVRAGAGEAATVTSTTAVPAPPSSTSPASALRSSSPTSGGSTAPGAGPGTAPNTGSSADHGPLRPLLGLLGLAGPDRSQSTTAPPSTSGSGSSAGSSGASSGSTGSSSNPSSSPATAGGSGTGSSTSSSPTGAGGSGGSGSGGTSTTGSAP